MGSTRFTCVGCGKCCNDHHVPLTLGESRQWAADGGAIIVLVEAFMGNGLGVDPSQLEHARRRSIRVRSGQADAWVAITFAAFNAGPCRHLDADNRCRIYTRRPLVCRIYPMEINPHIPLRTELKDCPSESWQQGPALIVGGQVADKELAGLIEQSRQADRDDIAAKAAICARLGFRVTALKGDGFAAYLPDMAAFTQACLEAHTAPGEQEWHFQLADSELGARLASLGAAVTHGDERCTLIPLRR
ncbi:YkgJ family cysteine cluster protein [Pseudomonas sp. R5(2019)]|uniref:YkgJ family cysteine cluster protein n=1 Tax=Pseudomonas sp. R5(2019) TaxID=2697566 RepID=UPI001411C5CD|nr:YkgJ family cysteine cluster protein [Pseudomonas sp. R5(2019)]NBA93667.1 YkgJ family cysteine cluster protein [Pseudomonas sp. R5(2019)]